MPNYIFLAGAWQLDATSAFEAATGPQGTLKVHASPAGLPLGNQIETAATANAGRRQLSWPISPLFSPTFAQARANDLASSIAALSPVSLKSSALHSGHGGRGKTVSIPLASGALTALLSLLP